MARKYDVTAFARNKAGHLLSVGHNSYVKTHPLMARLGAKTGCPDRVYIHAEIDALLKARARGEQVYSIEVVRYKANGTPACAKPCPSCQLAIREFKVKRVIHT